MSQQTTTILIRDVANRLRAMRELSGYTVAEMAKKIGITAEVYEDYERGKKDFPFSFLHKAANALNLDLTELLEGRDATTLKDYQLIRKGEGQITSEGEGVEIFSLAPWFRDKLAEPYYCLYEYDEALQDKPIDLVTHSGQEFDLILKGSLKVQIDEHFEILNEGDSIYYDSATPHGMIAVNGSDCVFVAVVIPGPEKTPVPSVYKATKESVLKPPKRQISAPDPAAEFVRVDEDEKGNPVAITYSNEESFNFAFDVVDYIADKDPGRLAMLHVGVDHQERRFTFKDISRESNRAANYFYSLGIRRGDHVMVCLKRHYQFWSVLTALHKLGAVAIPATDQLHKLDFVYRFEAGKVKAIICTTDNETAEYAKQAGEVCPNVEHFISVDGNNSGKTLDGWLDFNTEVKRYRSVYERPDDFPCGSEPSLAFFTSGTTGYPKLAVHNYKYALGHYLTASHWHGVDPNGLHFTVADTGWGKALWGKIYGQWLCAAPVFTYDFDRFDADDMLSMLSRYPITSFCAPPTIYRMLIRADLSAYDLSSIREATSAGEALNPEVFNQFRQATGVSIREGFGQTETTLSVATFKGTAPKPGSMGKPSALYKMSIIRPDGTKATTGEPGEIIIDTSAGIPCGLFQGYFDEQFKTDQVWHDGIYHTGDQAWEDEDGFYWFVGRNDDIIKSSGYRIGPFEIENVIMEPPYVLECGVSAMPDELRGQVVKASIVLIPGKEESEELKKEIQDYVKEKTAPYKYPRVVVFRESLPKTVNGKIQRSQL